MAEKERTLYILKYLWQNTDDGHYVTANELASYLLEQGIEVSPRTIQSDIELLQEFGVDVIRERKTQYQYHIGAREFELPELKLLVDAVESSRFISAKRSKELVSKLCALTSVHQEKSLNRQLYIEGRVKAENKKLYLNIDTIHNAINEKKKIRFQYFEYTVQRNRVHKHGGYCYVFSPYAMVWYNDNYYVLGYSEKLQDIGKFRVDRIDNAAMLDLPAVKKPKNFDAVYYLKNIFNMFDGKMETVRLKCTPDMMKVILDRFGDDAVTAPCDDGFVADVKIAVSQTFFGWIFGFGGKIRIISPTSVCDEYQNALHNAVRVVTGESKTPCL